MGRLNRGRANIKKSERRTNIKYKAMLHPLLGLLNLGGGELLLILLALLLVVGVPAAIVIILILVANRSSQKGPKPAHAFSAPPPPLSSQARDLEQELRTLAKLKAEGLITEEDFNLKKKEILGL
jgi:hypothetical protein